MLITKDTLNTSNEMPSYKTGQSHLSCQYCGSTEHHSNASSQVSTNPECKTKNQRPLYICPLLKNAKSQEKDYKNYKQMTPSQVIMGSVVKYEVMSGMFRYLQWMLHPLPKWVLLNTAVPKTYSLILDFNKYP